MSLSHGFGPYESRNQILFRADDLTAPAPRNPQSGKAIRRPGYLFEDFM
jgi:hypothetical protein